MILWYIICFNIITFICNASFPLVWKVRLAATQIPVYSSKLVWCEVTDWFFKFASAACASQNNYAVLLSTHSNKLAQACLRVHTRQVYLDVCLSALHDHRSIPWRSAAKKTSTTNEKKAFRIENDDTKVRKKEKLYDIPHDTVMPDWFVQPIGSRNIIAAPQRCPPGQREDSIGKCRMEIPCKWPPFFYDNLSLQEIEYLLDEKFMI